jgi:hypothetical protein
MTTRQRGLLRQAMVMSAITLGTWRTAGAHHEVLRFNLEEMEATADRVFVGRCAAIDTAREAIAQGHLPVTHYTFDVEQVLKGDVPAKLTFTQLGHPPRPAFKGEPSSHGLAVSGGIALHGAADYTVGDRLLMFLIPNYQNGLLTYPVGLDQGAFLIERDDSGELVARNNLNNLGLFTAPYNGTRMASADARVIRPDEAQTLARSAPLSSAARALADARGALPLAPLLELVRQIRAAHQTGGRQ